MLIVGIGYKRTAMRSVRKLKKMMTIIIYLSQQRTASFPAVATGTATTTRTSATTANKHQTTNDKAKQNNTHITA